jgi:ABC-2 type transport system ATP-binding protein
MCDRVAIIQKGKLVDVQSIQDIMNEDMHSAVVFESDDIELALHTLASHPSAHPKKVDGGIECWLDKQQIAEVNQILVQAGVKVYGIKKINPSLEDKFLEMTRSDQIA